MSQEELYQQLKMSRETIYKLSKQLEQSNKQIIYLKENIVQKD
jgi:biotin operon repressor